MSVLNKNQLLSIAVDIISYKNIVKKKKYRTKWVKDWLLKRNILSHTNLINELRLEPDDFRNYLRMNEDLYEELLHLVSPHICKKDTKFREAIGPHERLTATLRFLATGRSYEDLKFSTGISAQALGHIIPETCRVIYNLLRKEYLQFPKDENDWRKIAQDFDSKWNFPHCLGAIDGKHVRITAPANSGAYFYNYKGFYSVVLMGIVNSNYEFILCDVGCNGRVSDGGVINNTEFYRRLKNNSLQIPVSETIPGTNEDFPFVFVGDDAFQLRPDLLKPYSQANLSSEKKIFNYRLSRARNVVENTFGIMSARFRIFHTEINLRVDRIEDIVLGCCVLHNFLMKRQNASYCPSTSLDSEIINNGVVNLGLRSNPETNLQVGQIRNASISAKVVRDKFLHYFNNEGCVEWQDNMIK